MDVDRTPVVIGVGQVVERERPVAPLDLIERAARAAFEDAPGAERAVELVSVVNVLNGAGPAPATALARRLALAPARCETTTIGGNTPQWLVTRAAELVAAGELRGALIAGGEAVASQRRDPAVVQAAGDDGAGQPDVVVGDDRPGLGPAELGARLMLPAHVYPLFESVLAARAGRDVEAQRRFLGELMAPFTRVAAGHPCAWFRRARTAEEIARSSPDNRVTAEPYTKLMNAFISVDQAAALVVTSLGVARELGIEDRAVFVHSGADAADVWFPAARPDLGASPAIAAAGRAALEAAGIGIDDVALFDLYSCFPCAVEMAAGALGVGLEDSRGLTVTGGLPYFGGPGNNYTTHAIATVVERLRAGGGLALVTGLGWFVTKHAVGVYGAEPPAGGFRRGDTSAEQARIDATALPVVTGEEVAGTAVVEASTVVYDRHGAPAAAPVVARLGDGARVVASAAPEELESLRGRSLVGARVEVQGTPPVYRVSRLPG